MRLGHCLAIHAQNRIHAGTHHHLKTAITAHAATRPQPGTLLRLLAGNAGSHFLGVLHGGFRVGRQHRGRVGFLALGLGDFFPGIGESVIPGLGIYTAAQIAAAVGLTQNRIDGLLTQGIKARRFIQHPVTVHGSIAGFELFRQRFRVIASGANGGKIRTVVFTGTQIHKPAFRVRRMTVVDGLELDAGRQGQRIHLDGMQPRVQAVDTVLAVLVGNHPGAVLQIQLHATNGPLTIVLQVITVSIHIDLTEQHGLV